MPKLNYFNELNGPNGYTYSIDGCRVKFEAYKRSLPDLYSFAMSFRPDIDVSHISNIPFQYKQLFTFKYSDGCSMTMGLSFNGSNSLEDECKGYLDFNPNKVASFDQFWADYRMIKSCCGIFEFARVDLAVDIPVKSEMIILEKDNRKYSLEAYSLSNKTDYLGKRSHDGFVKVYNKTIESQLDYDLTRIEVTCSPSSDSFFKRFPKVWDISQNNQLTPEWLRLNDTDLAILRMELKLLAHGLDEGLMIFNSLARTKKQKLKPFLLPESCLVCCSFTVINNVFTNLFASFL